MPEKTTAKQTKPLKKVQMKENNPENIAMPEQKPKMTEGFIILLIYFGISIISALIALITGQAAQKGMFFGFLYSETAGLLMSIITIVILLVLGYGIIKRISWTRDLGIIYYGIMILHSIASIIVYFLDKQYVINFLISTIPASSIPEGVSLQSQAGMIGLWFVIGTIIGLLIFAIIELFYFRKNKYFTE